MDAHFSSTRRSLLKEYSVVFTDRSLNSMSKPFQEVMCGLHDGLTTVYGATTCALIPGGGSYAMNLLPASLHETKRCLSSVMAGSAIAGHRFLIRV